jgi:hypothetical protein
MNKPFSVLAREATKCIEEVLTNKTDRNLNMQVGVTIVYKEEHQHALEIFKTERFEAHLPKNKEFLIDNLKIRYKTGGLAKTTTFQNMYRKACDGSPKRYYPFVFHLDLSKVESWKYDTKLFHFTICSIIPKRRDMMVL